jgi:hypothetical protein
MVDVGPVSVDSVQHQYSRLDLFRLRCKQLTVPQGKLFLPLRATCPMCMHMRMRYPAAHASQYVSNGDAYREHIPLKTNFLRSCVPVFLTSPRESIIIGAGLKMHTLASRETLHFLEVINGYFITLQSPRVRPRLGFSYFMIHDVPASLGSLAGKHPPSLDLLSLQPSRVIINSFIIEFLFPLLSLGITVLAVASIRYIGLRLHAVGCKYLCLLKL